jgi:hypothetical protein
MGGERSPQFRSEFARSDSSNALFLVSLLKGDGMKGQKGLNSKVHKSPIWIVVFLAAAILNFKSVSAQIMVQPMMIDLSVRAGGTITQDITIQNMSKNSTETVDLTVLELDQGEEGMWMAVEPNMVAELSNRSSCRQWIDLSNAAVVLKPVSSVPVKMTLKVPRRSRGFYCAAILVQKRIPASAVGIVVTVNYLVPVLIGIIDKPLRRNVEINDIGLEFQQAIGENPATVIATMGIGNEGATFSDLRALARIRNFSEGHWKVITIADFERVGIIPGAKLNLKSDIGRPLPSGKYQVSGVLFADGQRVKQIEKEIDFVGDPNVKRVASDAELFLTPRDIIIENVSGGGSRSTTLKVSSFSDDTIEIKTALSMPPILLGSLGDLNGRELNCAGWVEVEPAEFTLSNNASRNIRITAKMPDSVGAHPWFYANLTFQATYKDGQNAGRKTVFVCVGNKNVQSKPSPRAVRLSVAAMEGSRYIVVARFANYGDVHFNPKCEGSLANPEGATVREIAFSGQSGLMLPFDAREFAAAVDFSGVKSGIYRLSGSMEYATGGRVDIQVPIQVSGQGSEKTVVVIRTDEFEKTLGVKWQ